MIIYGNTMQERSQEVPEEVAVWLLEQQAKYPLIDFQIGYTDYSDSSAEEMRQKYSMTWDGAPTGLEGAGVSNVSFLYLKESWFVRIIGRCDNDGNITDMSLPTEGFDSYAGLGAKLRAEIATMPPIDELEHIQSWIYDPANRNYQKDIYGLVRKEGEVASERGSLIPFQADAYIKSDLTISGAELHDVFHGAPSERKTALLEAMAAKDWERARQLLKQRH